MSSDDTKQVEVPLLKAQGEEELVFTDIGFSVTDRKSKQSKVLLADVNGAVKPVLLSYIRP